MCNYLNKTTDHSKKLKF